jgi:hypothetical protein
VVSDGYPNVSICGIPYYVSGEVGHWTRLAHRSRADLEATGMRLLLDTRATDIHPADQTGGTATAAGRSATTSSTESSTSPRRRRAEGSATPC